MRILAQCALVFALLPAALWAQGSSGLVSDPSTVVQVDWSVTGWTEGSDKSLSFEVIATVTIGGDYHIYGLDGTFKNEFIPDGTAFRLSGLEAAGLEAVGKPSPKPGPKIKNDEFMGVYPYFERKVSFHQTLRSAPFDFRQPKEFQASLTYSACNDMGCLPVATSEVVLKTPAAPAEGTTAGEKPAIAAKSAAVRATLDSARLAPGETVGLRIPLPAELRQTAEGLNAADVILLGAPLEVVGKPRREGGDLVVEIRTKEGEGEVDDGKRQFTGVLLLPESARLSFEGEIEIRRSILQFLAIAALAALLALLTPCVFPMIPITISFFTKQAEKSNISPKLMGFVYAFGIIGSFTAIGAIFTSTLGATGASDFATHPLTLGLIAGLFILFAFSLFGAFEIQLPSGLMNLAGGAQGKGGIVGVLLLGMLFAITTFTCTAPFVGGLLAGAAASGEWTRPLIGMLVFSGTLAVPFIVLSIFPSRLKALPKSGGWLNQVKVVMGFIELMAAFKFLGDMSNVLQSDLFSRYTVLLVWIVCSFAMGLYLLGVFRLPKDSPREKTGVLGLMLALGCFVFAISMLPGLSGDPVHQEIESYLPNEKFERTPEGREAGLLAAFEQRLAGLSISATGAEEDSDGGPEVGKEKKHFNFEHINDFEAAVQEAIKLNRPLFVDFTGYSCPNCRLVEKSTFRSARVKAQLNAHFVVATLYTDGKHEDEAVQARFEAQQAMLLRIASTVTNPNYVIMDPHSQAVLAHRGFDRSYVANPQIFADWLEKYRDLYKKLRP